MINHQAFPYQKIKITKGDRLLILFILFIGLILFLWNHVSSESGQYLFIFHDKDLIHRIPLNKNWDLDIKGDLGITHIVVRNGTVWIAKSPCPQKICMHMGKIANHGQSIVCIPNRIVLVIKKDHYRQIDGITM